jgi:hypothetical protein
MLGLQLHNLLLSVDIRRAQHLAAAAAPVESGSNARRVPFEAATRKTDDMHRLCTGEYDCQIQYKSTLAPRCSSVGGKQHTMWRELQHLLRVVMAS